MNKLYFNINNYRIFYILFIVFNSFLLKINAQDTIINPFNENSGFSNIENFGFSNSEEDISYLIETREKILENIEKNKIEQAKELINNLNIKYENSNNLAFWPNEKRLLLFWINDYQTLTSEAIIWDSISNQANFKIAPPFDMLAKIIKYYTADNKDTIINHIHKSDLSITHKEFLNLLFYYSVFAEIDTFVTQDYLNNKANIYLNKYADSKYNQFIKKNIRYIYKEAKSNFGIFFYLGYNQNTGNLNKYFSNGLPIGISIEYNYKKLYSALEFQTDFTTKVKKTFEYNVYYPVNLRLNYYQIQTNIGLKIIDNKEKQNIDLFISPTFRGFLISKTTSDYDLEYSNNPIGPKLSYTVGANYNIRISDKTSTTWGNKIHSSKYVRFQIGYSYPTLYQLDDVFKGSVIYFLIGIGGTRQVFKRDL